MPDVISRRALRGSMTLLVLGSALSIHAATPGTPLQAEARTNATTSGVQSDAVVARDALGNSVVVWSGEGSGDSDGVFFQRYDSRGVAQGSETRANSVTTGSQGNPSVAMTPDGKFVIAWETPDASDVGISAQLFTAAGVPEGSEFSVNTTTGNAQTKPDVAMAADGDFVIVWQSLLQEGSGLGTGLYAQRYTTGAVAAGTEFQLNVTTAFSQAEPSVGMYGDGAFVVAWTSNRQETGTTDNGIFARTFDASGAGSNEFQVNTTVAGEQTAPSLSVRAGGGFVVAWQGPDSDGDGVFVRAFDAAGNAQTGEISANETTVGDQEAAAVAQDANGNFVVAWQGPDAAFTGIFHRRFAHDGTAQGAESAVNSTTVGTQLQPGVASDADGDYVIVWGSDQVAAELSNVYRRRYVGPENVDLAITADDDTDPVGSGAAYKYVISVANSHAVSTVSGIAAVDAAIGTANGFSVTVNLPAGVAYGSATGTGWTCSAAGQVVTCTYSSNLAAATTTSVALSVTAPTLNPGFPPITPAETNRQLSASSTIASSNQHDSDTSDNTDAEVTSVCADAASARTVQFKAASFSVTEGTASATITLARAGSSCGVASVSYATADDSTGTAPATKAVDYTETTGSLTWANGDAADKTFTVPVANDSIYEGAQTVKLALSEPDAATLGALGTAILTINDNDTAPAVVLSLLNSPMAETDGTTATVTATLAATSERQATITLGYTGGATKDTDYTASAGTIIIPAGQTAGSVTLASIDDALDEDNETIDVSVTAVADATEAAQQQVQAIITDDDATPTVQFVVASSTLDEGTASTDLGLILSAAAGRPVTVSFAIGGTATAGAGNDYTVTSSPVTIAAGQATGKITITTINDTRDEPEETIEVTLTGATSATLGTDTTHIVTLSDNDATPTVSFTAPSVAVTEANSGTQQVTVTAQLSAVSNFDVTVPFTVSGTASNPSDHNAVSGAIQIPAGSPNGAYSFNVVNDVADDEDAETVVVTMGAPTNATEGSTAVHTTTITDNDATPTVSFTTASQNLAENGAGSATFILQLSAASARTITVPFSVGGTATEGIAADFTLTPATSPLTLAAGQTSVTFTINVSNDPIDEPNETAQVTLGTPTNATVGTTGAHVLTILDDDDQPQVTFTLDSQTASEAGGTAQITVRLSRSTGGDVNVPFSVAALGTADSLDYSISSSPVTVVAGETEATITVSLTNDLRDEDDQTVIVSMGTPSNATPTAPTTHTLTITDNDAAPSVSFVAAQTVTEGTGAARVVNLVATPSAVSEKVITVPFTVSGTGTATASGVDHDAEAGTITIGSGASSGSYGFNVTGDSQDENDETVVLAMGTPANASQGAGTVHTVTIADDDATPTVSFAAAQTVSEATGETTAVSLVATLSEASSKTVTVPFTLSGSSTATSGGGDHSAAAGTITIVAGSTSGSYVFNVTGDALDEANETVVLVMGTPVNASAGMIVTHTVTIADDDAMPGVTLSLTGSPFAENSGVASVTASLTAVSGRAVTVTLDVSGTAVPGTDYVASALSITIPAGSLTGAVTLTAVDDNADENDEIVTVTATALTNGTAVGAQQVDAILVDDDASGGGGGGGALAIWTLGLFLVPAGLRRRSIRKRSDSRA